MDGFSAWCIEKEDTRRAEYNTDPAGVRTDQDDQRVVMCWNDIVQ